MSENRGELFETINNKNKYIEDAVSEINKQINLLKDRIKIAEEQFNLSITELRIIYNCKVAEKIDSNFTAFKLNNTKYKI